MSSCKLVAFSSVNKDEDGDNWAMKPARHEESRREALTKKDAADTRARPTFYFPSTASKKSLWESCLIYPSFLIFQF